MPRTHGTVMAKSRSDAIPCDEVRFGHEVVGAEAESAARNLPPVWRSAIRHFHGCAALLPPCKL
jgi:hypothetical protein